MSGERLEGQVAIVTGGGRGLGRAMVLGLVAAGARVITTAAREASEVEAVAREAGNDRVVPILADVTREEDCARVVAMDSFSVGSSIFSKISRRSLQVKAWKGIFFQRDRRAQ